MVEDEFFVRVSVADELRCEGFDVLEAANADDALRILESGHRVDVVFSDVQMPGRINGMGLSAAVRDRFPATPVILTSGNTPADIGLGHGGIFVPKPCETDHMTSVIREALGGTASALASAARLPELERPDDEPRFVD